MDLKAIPVPAARPKSIKKIGWAVVFVLAVLMFLIASRYIFLGSDAFFEDQRATYLVHRTGIMLHVVGSMLAILLGPIQFLPRLQKGRLSKVHRWLGRVYLLGVLVGGVAGLYMAFLAYGGPIVQTGFALLAVLWLFSAFMAYKHIRNRDIARHREWMIRNFALTFAAVTLRLWLGVFQLIPIDFILAYRIVSWLSWVPNLLVAEWIVRRSMRHV